MLALISEDTSELRRHKLAYGKKLVSYVMMVSSIQLPIGWATHWSLECISFVHAEILSVKLFLFIDQNFSH